MRVLITGHNGFLGKSIVSKLYKNIEIIVVNDCSNEKVTDESFHYELKQKFGFS